MFGISFEHIVIIGVVLLIFGPKRLPDLGKSLGQSIKNFKDSFNGLDSERNHQDRIADKKPPNDDKPSQNS
jgi:sec-independent protein translocase protein TatA